MKARGPGAPRFAGRAAILFGDGSLFSLSAAYRAAAHFPFLRRIRLLRIFGFSALFYAPFGKPAGGSEENDTAGATRRKKKSDPKGRLELVAGLEPATC